MSVVNPVHQKKWINAAIAIFSLIVGFVAFKLLSLVGDRLELESKISHYTIVLKAVAFLVVASCLALIKLKKDWSAFLDEVFVELTKVVWPDGQLNIRHTFGVIVGVTIVGFILGAFDYGVSKLLNLIYK